MKNGLSTEARITAGLARLVQKTPEHPANIAKLLAGQRLVSVKGVERESGVSRSNFGSSNSRYSGQWKAIREASKAEANRGLSAQLLEEKAESRRLRRLLHLTQVHNASLQLRLSKLKARSEEDDTVTPFRVNRRNRKR